MLATALFSPLRILLISCLLVQAGVARAATTALISNPPPAKSKPQLTANYGKLPLSFEANQGQTDPSVQFLVRGQGYTLFLRSGEAVLTLNPAHAQSNATPESPIVRIKLAGADLKAPAVAKEEQITRTNYFLGNNPTQWRTNIPNYGRVRYRSVYDGIDLVYYGNQRRLEHDFIVAPNADPSKIVLSLSGTQNPHIDPATGDLILSASTDSEISLRLLKPIAYQESNGHRIQVSSSYKLLAPNEIGFSIAAYDHARPLTIDPVLTYSTYLGGSGSSSGGDQGNGIAVDSAGDAYVVGTTYSINFPLTTESFQSTNNSALAGHGSTVFVTKLNATGTALLYSTYFGGSGGDSGYGIAVDSSNNVYIAGATYSSDFPVTCGAFQTINESAGASTAFVVKLNPNINELTYSTYLGGGSHATPAKGDVAQAIAVDASGDAYVTGYTDSSNFPVTDGAFQTVNNGVSMGSSNAFVTKLNSLGTALVYSTFLGGTGGDGDYGNGIALDAAGDAYVTGSTGASNFPTTSGAVQPARLGAPTAFVTELNPTGTDEVYSTYLGGSNGDSAQAIALDSSGFAYVAGNTSSSNFPITDGALEGADIVDGQIFAYGSTAFVTKLNKDGSALEYSTYLEGLGTSVSGLAVDSTGTAYVSGTGPLAPSAGFAGGFLETTDALPVPSSTNNSGFVVKLNPSGTALNYATLIGGSSSDGATALALDAAGSVYVTGLADSTDFPITSEAFQTTNNATEAKGSNAFVSKLSLATETATVLYPAPLASPVPTSLSVVSEQVLCAPDYYGLGGSGFTVLVNLMLNSASNGLPPTGSIYMEGDFTVNALANISGSWGGTGVPVPGLAGNTFGGYPPTSIGWDANYSGDALYAPSSASGSVPTPTDCLPGSGSDIRSDATNGTKITSTPLRSPQIASTPAKPIVSGPKFTPSPAILQSGKQASPSISSVQSQVAPACIAPKAILTVALHDSWRYYGAANPVFTYTVTGLLGSDTVTVTPQTTATPASPAGNYPVTAVVSGPDAANYTINVVSAILQVRKAPLYVQANDAHSIYGQAPPPLTAYFAGFVNGDTVATAVTGAPVLTTTVTAATPCGAYKIGVQIGTLAAANYYFNLFGSGEGSVDVARAILEVVPNDLTMTQGGPVPPLTYTVTGFVNGDTAANALTGAPMLSTPVTSSTPKGHYSIFLARGTLAGENYYIQVGEGVMTVLP